ncbi:Hypothetical protein FKW44_003227 [Caligus rogercresseyi]|uniref:Uncharacterized protein n=1 Tax=Caligus rogercresseyi TaxID=217165 RepID=A0A7T8QWY4_CALRO|nr:Hypothetical protein FKW44_003227 [Caligus rogercresseyi]
MASGHINLNGHFTEWKGRKLQLAVSARRKMKLQFISSTIVHGHGLEWRTYIGTRKRRRRWRNFF